MKTTLIIPDPLFRRLKQEAARRDRTLSSLVEAALVSFLEPPRKARSPLKLPTFDMGRSLVDVADRNALFDALESTPVRR